MFEIGKFLTIYFDRQKVAGHHKRNYKNIEKKEKQFIWRKKQFDKHGMKIKFKKKTWDENSENFGKQKAVRVAENRK